MMMTAANTISLAVLRGEPAVTAAGAGAGAASAAGIVAPQLAQNLASGALS